MKEQLQAMGKLNLDLALATSKTSRVGITKIQAQAFIPGLTPDLEHQRMETVTIPILNLADLKAGKNWLDIQHSNYAKDRQKPYYATNIINRSSEKIRIDRFATYTQLGDTLVMHSITGGFLTSQQFQEWYDLGKSIWIKPGQVVTDPNNHSNIGVYWVYFGTTASGQHFVAGSAWNGKPWWQLW